MRSTRWCYVLVLAGGCVFGSTDATKKALAEENKARTTQSEALAKQDFATVLGYDDVFVSREGGLGSEHDRTMRKNHFRAWLAQELTSLGPPTKANLDAQWGTLVAFRHEARRSVEPLWIVEEHEQALKRRKESEAYAFKLLKQNEKRAHPNAKAEADYAEGEEEDADAARDYKTDEQLADEANSVAGTGERALHAGDPIGARRADLGEVDKAEIAPRFEQLAPAMWKEIAAKDAAGEGVLAIQLGRSEVAELPPTNSFTAQLAELTQRIAAGFLEHAKAAGDEHAGARVLHAKIAAAVGADPGPLVTPTAELLAATGAAWKIEAPPECGGYVDADNKKTSLEAELRDDGWAVATTDNAPLLRVKLDSCPLADNESQTTETIPYAVEETRTETVTNYEQHCMPDTYGSSTEDAGDYILEKKWKIPGGCSDVASGTSTIDHHVKVHHTEQVIVHHHNVSQVLHGTIEMTVPEPKTGQAISKTWDVNVTGTSPDDPEYKGVNVAKAREGFSALEATQHAAAALVNEIGQHRVEILQERAKQSVAQAQAASTTGNTLEADDAFYVAAQLGTAPGAAPVVPAEMATWMASTYHVPAEALTAALAGKHVPRADLAAGHDVKANELQLHLYDYDKLNDWTGGRDLGRQLTLLFAGGVTKTENASGKSTGGLVDLSVNTQPTNEGTDWGGKMFGFQMIGGGLGTGGGHMFFDFDFLFGYGLHSRSWWLGPTAGIGGSFMTGTQDLPDNTPNFTVWPAFMVNYGARVAYVFPKNAKIELFYNKGFRSSARLAEEKRAEVRLFYNGLAGVLRYTEYLDDVDNIYSAFSSKGRDAKATWFLFGFGI